ncbi:hypothetical protein AB0I28_21600 [Phytomonospora sp. NPDC050363]|uniref:hypothetical protein n=1 Tax=Phytomonospora sp. NPDC050363 TaxID=3155642 RepID=UPI0033FB91FE
MAGPKVVAPTGEIDEVGRRLLPAIAGVYAKATQSMNAACTSVGGPAGWEILAFAQAAQRMLAESGDNSYDAAVGLAKIAAGYDSTDNVNAELLPKDPDVVFPTAPDPKLRTL